MGLLSYETKIDHHEGGELSIGLECNYNISDPTITIGSEAARDRITLTLDELDQLLVAANAFRQSIKPFGE
jgi:hypothetical protein